MRSRFSSRTRKRVSRHLNAPASSWRRRRRGGRKPDYPHRWTKKPPLPDRNAYPQLHVDHFGFPIMNLRSLMLATTVVAMSLTAVSQSVRADDTAAPHETITPAFAEVVANVPGKTITALVVD